MLNIQSKFIRYAIVGVIGTFTHVGILSFLVEIFNCNPVISSTAGFLITVIISYYLNYRWTFNSNSKHRFALPRYIAVSVMALCLNTAIMYTTINIFNLWYIIGQTISIVVIPIHNYLLNSYWSFKT